jgi:hypothetical protein
MKFIKATEYHVTLELSRDDCQMLAETCQYLANEEAKPQLEAIATMFVLAIEATKFAEVEGMDSEAARRGLGGPDVPPAFYDK